MPPHRSQRGVSNRTPQDQSPMLPHPRTRERAHKVCKHNERDESPSCESGVVGPISQQCIPWDHFAMMKLRGAPGKRGKVYCYDASNLAKWMMENNPGNWRQVQDPVTQTLFQKRSLDSFHSRYRELLVRQPSPAPSSGASSAAPPPHASHATTDAPLTTTTIADVYALLQAQQASRRRDSGTVLTERRSVPSSSPASSAPPPVPPSDE